MYNCCAALMCGCFHLLDAVSPGPLLIYIYTDAVEHSPYASEYQLYTFEQLTLSAFVLSFSQPKPAVFSAIWSGRSPFIAYILIAVVTMCTRAARVGESAIDFAVNALKPARPPEYFTA